MIVEGDLAEARFLEEAVLEIAETSQAAGHWFGVRTFIALDLEDATSILAAEEVDAVLLNPNLYASRGLDTFRRLRIHAPDLPFILVVDDADELPMARLALREGAQDYLLRAEVDCKPLAHAVDAGIERARVLRALWRAFQFDECTGLPNRPGFLYLGEWLKTLLARLSEPVRLIIAELPAGLPSPPPEMDVLEAAELLRGCIDTGDLVGRVAPRHFCVLSSTLTSNALKARIAAATSPDARRLRLRWSELETNATSDRSIEDLLAAAEQTLDESRLALSVIQ